MSSQELSEFFEAELGGFGADDDVVERPTVLIIDDDRHVRASLELLLSTRYRVRACANADQGFAAMSDDVATVILDIKMAGMDGFEAYDLLRTKDEDVPIIFHSAYQDVKSPYEIMNRYRPFGYITKSGSVTELLHAIEAAVSHRARLLRQRMLAETIVQIQAELSARARRGEADSE